MGKTQAVNFRADENYYKAVKKLLEKEPITVSDVLNATLRKIAIGALDASEFVSSDAPDSQYQVAFEDLKNEILKAHQQIAEGRVTELHAVRKEFGLD